MPGGVRGCHWHSASVVGQVANLPLMRGRLATCPTTGTGKMPVAPGLRNGPPVEPGLWD